MKLEIKPLSVNECWRGRRYKTDSYKMYELKVLRLLPPLELPLPPFSVYYEFGFSSASADLDNPIKPFQDILQKRYKFNDNQIFEIMAHRVKVPKGAEYIRFEIKTKIN